MKSQHSAKRKRKSKANKPNRLLINGHLPFALPLDVGVSLVTFLLVELTAEQKDFLVYHVFPPLTDLSFLSFTEAMLVGKKDAVDLLKKTKYDQQLEQWEQHGECGERPKRPRYRYRALRTSTKQITSKQQISIYGGVKKLNFPRMIYFHCINQAYTNLAQHTQSAHLDQRRINGRKEKTCWDLIVEWIHDTSHLTDQQRVALIPHLPSSSPTIPLIRKRGAISSATRRKSKRARTLEHTNESPSTAANSTAAPAAVTYVEKDSFHPILYPHPMSHPHPHPSPMPPHLVSPLPTSAASSSWESSLSESQSIFHQELDSIYGLPAMDQHMDDMEPFRGQFQLQLHLHPPLNSTDVPVPASDLDLTTPASYIVMPQSSTTPLLFSPALQAAVDGASKAAPPAVAVAAAASFPSQPCIAHEQSVTISLDSPSSQGDDDDWDGLDSLNEPDLPLNDMSCLSPFRSPSSPSLTLSPTPTLFHPTDSFFDAFPHDL